MSRGELVLWAICAWLVPAVLLATGHRSGPAAAEVRLEGLRAGSANPYPAPALARLDLNRATAAELDLLPGIGAQRARQIVARRAEKGPFQSVWELTALPGFSRPLVERLDPLLTVRPACP